MFLVLNTHITRMKSLAMFNLKNISPETDFYFIKQQLNIINKNVLYITHMQDKILKLLQEEGHDKDLQTQVDKFYPQDGDVVVTGQEG